MSQSALDKIKAKRLDGPHEGVVKEFTRHMFKLITNTPSAGKWEVVEDANSAPKESRVEVKEEEVKAPIKQVPKAKSKPTGGN